VLFLGSNFREAHHFWGDPYLNSTTVLFDEVENLHFKAISCFTIAAEGLLCQKQ